MRTAIAVVLLFLVTACGGGEDNPKTFDVLGKLTLSDAGSLVGGTGKAMSPCFGKGGYDDIEEGAQVVIRNDDGKTVGLGTLEEGVSAKDVGQFSGSPCAFVFLVEDVEDDGSKFYSVEVSGRGETQFTKSDARLISLTLG